ncbi:hypothetical protein AB0J57_33445 [Streptomyces sp. NPDC049837]|uniref:hypothetical protein n=1 Tax=Streptomyces sp. NPDC049837 TaxID=3155277 RepID=UPI00342A7DEC
MPQRVGEDHHLLLFARAAIPGGEQLPGNLSRQPLRRHHRARTSTTGIWYRASKLRLMAPARAFLSDHLADQMKMPAMSRAAR